MLLHEAWFETLRTRINGLGIAAVGTKLSCGCVVVDAGQTRVCVA